MHEYLGNHLQTLLIAHLNSSAMSHVMAVLTRDERIATSMLTNSENWSHTSRSHVKRPAITRLSSTADSLRPKVRITGGRLVLLPEHTTAANFGLVPLSSWRKILKESFAFTHNGQSLNRGPSTPPIPKATMWLTGRSYVYESTTRTRAIYRILTDLRTCLVSSADALPVREESRCGAPR
jgi:hypothetical protein